MGGDDLPKLLRIGLKPHTLKRRFAILCFFLLNVAIVKAEADTGGACPSPDAPWAERDAWRAAHPVQSARARRARNDDGDDEAAEWKRAIASGVYEKLEATPAMQLLGKASASGDLGGTQRAIANGAHPAPAMYGDNGFMSMQGEDGSTTYTGGTSTALLVAALHGHASVVRFLVAAAGADPDAGDSLAGSTYITPMHAACDKGHADVVRVLLALGAKPGVATEQGKRTPAMLAAMRGHIETLRALGEGASGRGDEAEGGGLRLASVNALNEYDRTALDYAQMRRHAAVAAFLRDELGAKLGADIIKGEAAFAADMKKK